MIQFRLRSYLSKNAAGKRDDYSLCYDWYTSNVVVLG